MADVWKKARKKPVVIEYREPIVDYDGLLPAAERIETREGVLYGYPGIDYIIKGVDGELYPIKKDIFEKTYDRIADAEDLEAWRDTFWKEPRREQ